MHGPRAVAGGRGGSRQARAVRRDGGRRGGAQQAPRRGRAARQGRGPAEHAAAGGRRIGRLVPSSGGGGGNFRNFRKRYANSSTGSMADAFAMRMRRAFSRNAAVGL